MKIKSSFLPDFSTRDLFYDMHKRGRYLDNLKRQLIISKQSKLSLMREQKTLKDNR